MMTKELEEEKSLRELLLALNEGLTVYRSLNKNYVPIKVSFSQCAYMTATTAIEELQAYIADLDRDICREPLCLDLDEMGSEDYWMEKLSKLRSDMVELEEVPLLQRKLIWGYLGFYPWTTTEFYMGVEEKVMEVARLIRLVQQKMAEKPLSFYGKFYHDQRALYCEEPAVKDFKHWLSHSGIITLIKLKMLRAKKIADFINSGILRLALGSCDIEGDAVDVERFKKQLPRDYPCVKDFDVLCTVFSRTIGRQGDILIPNYNCAGLFIFQHWAELTEEQINAIFYLDKMLELIHAELDYTRGQALGSAASLVEERCVNCVIEDTLLSALFREECHEELKTVIDSWRPYLKDIEPDEDALHLSTFHFDLDQIQPSTVYLDFARLISQDALMVPMSNLATYMFNHSNLSKSENALYVQLKRYKKMCEQTRKKSKKRK